MKKIIWLSIVLVLGLNLVAQKSTNTITVMTKDSLASFQLYLNGDRQNSIFTDSLTVEGLDSSDVKITVSFKNREYADKTELASFVATNHRIYEIVQKPKVFKSVAHAGRKVGNLLKIGKHEKDKELIDLFYLKDLTVLDQFSE